MKKFKTLKMFGFIPTAIGTVVGLGLILSLSMCKKTVEIQTVGNYSIAGVVMFPGNNGIDSAAHGAVLKIYPGADTSSGVLATTFADGNGNYKFNGLLAGAYVISAKYNTVNQNARQVSDGFNFITFPLFTATITNASLTGQNITLVNITSSGTAKISYLAATPLDSVTGYRLVTFETHSKIDFSFPDNSNEGTSTSTTNSGINVTGGFNKFQMDYFIFDEANPQNIAISGWTLLSSSNTFEPTRDAMGLNGGGSGLDSGGVFYTTGCSHKTMDDYIDSASWYNNPPNTPDVAIPGVDTARFVCTPGNVQRYGDGYVAHGTLTAFYHHLTAGPFSNSIADGNYNYFSDTAGFFAANGFQCPITQDGFMQIPVTMYFIYSKTQITVVKSGVTSFNWWFDFEGQFSFKPLSQAYLVSNGHLGDNPLVVSVNVNLYGTKNVAY